MADLAPSGRSTEVRCPAERRKICPGNALFASKVRPFPPQSGAGMHSLAAGGLEKQLEVFMSKLVPLSMLAAAVLLFGGLSANAQQKNAPAKARGAGAECSRMTDAKARDECVHAQSKDKSSKDTDMNKNGSSKHEGKGKGKKG
jgi:hypothetical protein